MRKAAVAAALLLGAAAAGCGESTPTTPGGPTVDAPGRLEARYEWALDGWVGRRPAGQPTVSMTWALPTQWRGEPFRVYGRRSSDPNYRLLATVTSCGAGQCRYVDANVLPGQEYDFYVAVVDEASGREVTSPSGVRVRVPAAGRPAAPPAPTGIALDGMAYLRWTDVADGSFLRYLVFQEQRDADSVFFEIGATDGAGFLDALAANGTAYRYSVAVMDTSGHISDRSPLSAAVVPRPDATGELVYAFGDQPQQSGFQFDAAARTGRVVAGNSPLAHWRLVYDDPTGRWLLEPLNGAQVTPGVFTDALTCGPGSDPGCEDVRIAPTTGYQATAVPLRLEHTYVFRIGTGSAARFAKVRVQILGFGGTTNDALMIFEWAFQTRPGEPSLSVE